jgi:hypothetical protein
MTNVEYELLKELTDICKRILALNKSDVSFSPMMVQSVKHHINGLQRLIFCRDGMRAYRLMHSDEIIEGLKTADPKLRQDIIKTMQGMGMPVREEQAPEIRTFKPGVKIPKGWQRVPYTRHQYAKVGDTKLVDFETVHRGIKKENINVIITPPQDLPAVRQPFEPGDTKFRDRKKKAKKNINKKAKTTKPAGKKAARKK